MWPRRKIRVLAAAKFPSEMSKTQALLRELEKVLNEIERIEQNLTDPRLISDSEVDFRRGHTIWKTFFCFQTFESQVQRERLEEATKLQIIGACT